MQDTNVSSLSLSNKAKLILITLCLTVSSTSHASITFINEFHYDNDGPDIGEGVEIAGSAGQSLEGWSVLFYNGNNGEVYKSETLSGSIDDEGDGFGALAFSVDGLQNGPADGIALVDADSNVIEFISYEGSLLATNGAATGLNSVDVGIAEPMNLESGFSIQRTGSGLLSDNFDWEIQSASFGLINNEQEFVSAIPLPAALPLFISSLCGLVFSVRRRPQ